MKLNQHIDYSDTNDAIIALTKTYFKTGDGRVKAFRDLLEEYLEKEIIAEGEKGQLKVSKKAEEEDGESSES